MDFDSNGNPLTPSQSQALRENAAAAHLDHRRYVLQQSLPLLVLLTYYLLFLRTKPGYTQAFVLALLLLPVSVVWYANREAQGPELVEPESDDIFTPKPKVSRLPAGILALSWIFYLICMIVTYLYGPTMSEIIS